MKLIQGNPWVWVVVLDPGGNEQFLGKHDKEKDISYIPTFLKKEEALQYLKDLTSDDKKKYEIQAIQWDQLAGDAAQHGFLLFILTSEGKVLEEIKP